MTATPPAVTTRVCRACHAVVPAAGFCGSCGAETAVPETYWRLLLRPRVYAAAPHEPVIWPLITSSLFPHLGRRARNPFRFGLVLLAVGMVVFAMLRMPGPLVTLCGLGVPVLFGLYLWQSGELRDVPSRTLAVVTLLGAALGVGWVLLTGGMVARAYGIPMAAGFVLEHLVGVGLAISLGGAALMVLPALLVRLLRPAVRESLDGFVVGALGALAFTGSAAITRLAPQFVAGMTDHLGSGRLLAEAVLYGIAVPITAAAAGGLIGVLLWFRPGERAGEHPRRMRASLLFFTAAVVAIYSAVWIVDAARLPKGAQLLLHLALTVLALLALRSGTQMALLHEAPDPASGEPVLCEHCEKVVPDMAFCPSCGAAARALSRSSRRSRRQSPPQREPGGAADR
jgi:RNA polymerase subunit RPABC4/transcription elongation factor Spt4